MCKLGVYHSSPLCNYTPRFLNGRVTGGSETPSFVALTETRELTVLALPRRDLEATPKITLIEFERTDYFIAGHSILLRLVFPMCSKRMESC